MSNYTSILETIYEEFELVDNNRHYSYHTCLMSSEEVIDLFREVTFPKIENLSRLTVLPDHLLVLCCSNPFKRKLCGTVIMKFEDSFRLQIIAFLILPEFRNSGSGMALLKQSERLAKTYNVNQISARYRTYWQYSDIWDRMLDISDYQQHETLLWYVSMPDANVQFGKEWLQKASFEAPYHIEDWNDYSFQRLEVALKSELWNGLVRKTLDPFQLKKLLLPHVSFILKKGDLIVGWLVCHLIGHDIVQCSSLIVHPTEAKGQGLKMVAEAFKRRKLGHRVIFSVEKDNEAMLSLTKKYIAGGKAIIYENRLRRKEI